MSVITVLITLLEAGQFGRIIGHSAVVGQVGNNHLLSTALSTVKTHADRAVSNIALYF
jgi:hypothetical protein